MLHAEVSRRNFLGGLGLAALGLSTGVMPLRALAEESLQATAFVHIAANGVVSIMCHRSEMGQGVRSSLPMLIADEMGAKLSDVRVVQADGDKCYGDQNTDGSTSVRNGFVMLRTIGATARTLLVSAAAARWHVEPDACIAQNSCVVHTPTQRSVTFGALVHAASSLPIPQAEHVVLRPREQLQTLGRVLPLYDGMDWVTGRAQFGADVALPNMQIALIARPPAAGGLPKSFAADAALAVRGVTHVIEMPAAKKPFAFKPWGGVAVLADTTWAAMCGRAALDVVWEAGDNGSYDSDEHRLALRDAVMAPGKSLRDKGQVDTALAQSARRIEAFYHVPYQAHAPMEPPVALARVSNGTCEVWAPTQNPQIAREEVAKALGMSQDAVTVHVTFLGGAFGRKAKADFVVEAAWLAKKVGVPVRVQFTREDDVQHDYYHSISMQRLEAGLDAEGRVVAWKHRTAFPPIGSTFDANKLFAGAGDLQQGILDLPLGAAHVRAETCASEARTRIGWLRSVCNIYHAFAVQSFIDELAQARGICTKQMLKEVWGPPRDVTLADLGVEELPNYGASLAEHPIDVRRLHRVADRVCELAQWDTHKAQGRSLGLAVHRSFLAYVGVIMSVVHDPQGRVHVDEAWIVADAGTVLNLDRVVAQLEGAVIFGMSIALHGTISMRDGVTQQSNFRDYKLVRMAQAPRQIHVEVIQSDAPPGGVGEPGVPPVAPALANAIFALTGTRIRDLPIAATLRV